MADRGGQMLLRLAKHCLVYIGYTIWFIIGMVLGLLTVAAI